MMYRTLNDFLMLIARDITDYWHRYRFAHNVQRRWIGVSEILKAIRL